MEQKIKHIWKSELNELTLNNWYVKEVIERVPNTNPDKDVYIVLLERVKRPFNTFILEVLTVLMALVLLYVIIRGWF